MLDKEACVETLALARTQLVAVRAVRVAEAGSPAHRAVARKKAAPEMTGAMGFTDQRPALSYPNCRVGIPTLKKGRNRFLPFFQP